MKKIIVLFLTLCMLLTSVIALPLTADAAEDDWTKGWSMLGVSKRQNGKLVFESKPGELAYATKAHEFLTNDFDIEFTLQVLKFDGTMQHHVQVGTPKHRLHWYVTESGINVEIGNGTSATRETVPVEMGNTPHDFRVVSYDGVCDMYIDGYYVKTYPLRQFTTAGDSLYFRTDGSTGGGHMVVTNVKFNDPHEAKDAAPTEEAPVEEEQERVVADSFEYHFDGTEDLSPENNWNLRYNWGVKDGYLGGYSDSLTYISSFKYIENFGDDFTFEAKMRFPSTLGNTSGMNFTWGDTVVLFRMRPHDSFVHTSGGTYFSDEFDMSDPEKWHDFKVESYNNKDRVRAYVNGVCVADVQTYKTIEEGKYVPAPKDTYWYFYCAGFPELTCAMQFDWVKFTSWNYVNNISVDGPFDGAEYYEGQDVNVSASVKDGLDIPSVSYMINGQEVATGQAPDYKATLKDLPEGKYSITAKAGEETSKAVQFEVFPAIKGEISAKQVDNKKLEASLENIQDKRNQIASVEYVLDGIPSVKVTSKPYRVTISDVSADAHTLTAILRDKDGVQIGEINKTVMPDLSGDNVTRNYSNEISYTVTGESGDAVVSVGNGNHLVQMTHTPDGVTYLTNDGEETFKGGVGKYTILTDGPFADVYWNGQLAFSYYLKFNDSVVKDVKASGLKVEDLSISIPENRKNYFVKRNVSDKNAFYVLDDVTAWNNIDFVADQKDEFTLSLNDGYYYTKLIMKDGKFYTWSVFEENSEPEVREFLEAAPEGKNHYRVEIGCGMVRFYVNGKWTESFRAVPTVGDAQIGVQVSKGEIDYLSVNDYTDLYLYQEDFKNSALYESIKYWTRDKLQALINEKYGIMTLVAADSVDAFAELYAYAGEAEMSAELDLTQCDGGFWFVANHSVEEEFTRVGYNAVTKKFEIVDVNGDETNLINTTVKEVDGELPLKKTINFAIKLDETATGKKISLFVDGKEVLSHEDDDIMMPMTQRGKLGFMLTKASANIYNVSYRGDAKPLLNAHSNNPVPSSTSNFDLIENDDGVVLVNTREYWATTDGGRTYTKKAASGLQSVDFEELANGEVLSVKMVAETTPDGLTRSQFIAAVSQDGGKSYEQVGVVSDWQGYVTTTGNRVYQGESGRIYFMRALEGSENDGAFVIDYSDDNGRTWKVTEKIDYLDVGGTTHEPKMIELQDGHCILFIRSEFGATILLDSYDYGETWDEAHPRMLPFFTAANAFNVEQDHENRNIIYIGWPYDNANLGGLIQYPRTRWAVARSNDWGETWEYIGTTMEYTRHEASHYNMCFNISEDYIVHNSVSLAYGGDRTPERSLKWGGRIIFTDRDQVATKRFERLHLRYPTQVDDKAAITMEQAAENLAINTENGRIIYKGSLIENGGYQDAVLAEYAAASVGARLEKTADSAILTVGDAKVTFDGDAVLVHDGKVYIKLKKLAESFGRAYAERDGIVVMGMFDNWSNRAWRGYHFATDVLTDEY